MMDKIQTHAYGFYKVVKAPGDNYRKLETLESEAKKAGIDPCQLSSYIQQNEATLSRMLAAEKKNLTDRLEALDRMNFGTGAEATEIREKLKSFA